MRARGERATRRSSAAAEPENTRHDTRISYVSFRCLRMILSVSMSKMRFKAPGSDAAFMALASAPPDDAWRQDGASAGSAHLGL